MRRQAMWPMYFATRNCRMLDLHAGDPFPEQNQGTVIGLGKLFGCPDAATRDLPDLPYVAIVDVGDMETEHRILRERIPLKDVRQMLEQRSA